MMDDAKSLTEPQERAEAWAEIDKKITELAPADRLGLGQDPAHPLEERERRGRARSSAVGPGLHVAEVAVPGGPATARGGAPPVPLNLRHRETRPWPPTSSADSSG